MNSDDKKWPGTEAETRLAEYLVRTAGGHFVTVVRRGVGEMLGVRVPGQTFVVQELMEAASSEVDRLQSENAALRIDASNHAADAETVRREREDERRRAEAAEAEVKRYRETLHMISAGHGSPIALANNTLRPRALASIGGEHHAE